jgi:hypothetical protein
MTSDPPGVQQLGAAVLIQGAALRDLYLCLHSGIAVMSGNGHSPALMHAVKQQVYRALMSARGHTVAEPGAAQGHSNCQGAVDSMSVAEAAAELGVSHRHMRRLSARFELGERLGATWMLRRGAVLAHKAQREKGIP